jgi:hypothetical protein
VARGTLALVAALASSCGGGASSAPPTLSAAAPAADLYIAAARDRGFDFDGRVWEIERLPQSSLIRKCIHVDGVSPSSFFAIGCTGELTQRRDYEYAWQLRSESVPCRIDRSLQDREVLLAFTHGPSADEIPRPMLRAWIGPGAFQWSSEAATSIELARQHLGHWPDATR